jgi:hypothetical protein
VRWFSVLLFVSTVGALAGCSGSSQPDGPPGLDRIDGPAQVDPSYDPFATTSPPVTDAGG